MVFVHLPKFSREATAGTLLSLSEVVTLSELGISWSSSSQGNSFLYRMEDRVTI